MTDEERQIRASCCDDIPKPCSYHEGWLDGLDIDRDQAGYIKIDVDADRLDLALDRWDDTDADYITSVAAQVLAAIGEAS